MSNVERERALRRYLVQVLIPAAEHYFRARSARISRNRYASGGRSSLFFGNEGLTKANTFPSSILCYENDPGAF
jgi:hypothetical protein